MAARAAMMVGRNSFIFVKVEEMTAMVVSQRRRWEEGEMIGRAYSQCGKPAEW